MSQSRLRITIFALWLGFWLICSATLALAPWFRNDIERTDILPGIISITGIWVPPLTCLAAFWFPQGEQKKARSIKANRERAIAALALTICYLGFVWSLVVYSTFFITANKESFDPSQITLLGQLGESVKIALMVSPIALAPINWLTSSAGRRL